LFLDSVKYFLTAAATYGDLCTLIQVFTLKYSGMRKINPFFIIGTVGMLITSLLHIFMAAITSQEAASASFWMLYPGFLTFLILGTVIMAKREGLSKE
jgi:hypothetical protein